MNRISKTASSDPSPRTARYIRRLLAVAWQYRLPSLVVVVLHVLLVALQLGGLRLAGLGIDVVRHALDPSTGAPQWPWSVAPPLDWSPMATLVALSAAVLLVAVMIAVVKFTASVAAADLSQRVLIGLRTEVYDKLQRLSFHFFDTAETSSLINRAAGDVQAVRTFVDGVIVKLLVVLLSLGVYLAYMLSVHVPLTIACLATSPLLWWGAVMFSRMVQPEYRRSAQLGDRLISTLAENIQGVHVVKGFARQEQEIARFRAANREVRDQKQRIFWKVSTYQPLMGLLTQVNMLALIGLGGYLVVRGEMPLGAGLFVMANLLHEFANQVGQITNIANTIQTSLTGAERVFEVLDAPVEIDSPREAVRLNAVRPVGGSERPGTTVSPARREVGLQITFDRVSFAYRDGPRVIQDLSLDVRPGESIGIMGETGAGKSTLLSLVPRFYDVTAGAVRVDGQDVRTLDLDDLRRSIGIVFQESFLFSNTVAANIAFGHPEATREAIGRAARLAAAEEFISQLPEGYDAIIGEHGSNLSGGQRQRLAIARALLLDPPILLLDDATASVDARTEHEIQQALQQVMRGRTTLFVSNRVSTLQRADRIVVLQDGRIVQIGTPEQLQCVPGRYRRLVELQFADLSNERVRATA